MLGTLAGGGGYTAEAKLEPLDAEMARAACALILTGLFVTRTARTYGVGPFSKGRGSFLLLGVLAEVLGYLQAPWTRSRQIDFLYFFRGMQPLTLACTGRPASVA